MVTAAFRWLDATLARDFDAQSAFYPERMDAFYLWRDVPKSAVMAEKRRVFDEARTIDIRIDPPQLIVDPGARSGRMYFRKTYVIAAKKGKLNRNGEVLQELRWAKKRTAGRSLASATCASFGELILNPDHACSSVRRIFG